MTNIPKTIIQYSGHSEDYQAGLYDTLNRIFVPSYGIIFTRSLSPTDVHLRFETPRDLENRITWQPYDQRGSTFTDPKRFDPNKFQFIVHTIGAGPIEMVANANEDFRRRLLSCSIINQTKTTTFTWQFGFILRVPAFNIYATTPCDMFLVNKEIDKDKDKSKPDRLDRELTRVNTKFGISTPEDILARSHPSKINEIAVLGDGVTVIGVFRKVLRDTSATKGDLYPRFKSYAETHNLPIVNIPVSYMTAKQRAKKMEDKTMTKTELVKQDSSDFSHKSKKKSKLKQSQMEQPQRAQKSKKKSAWSETQPTSKSKSKSGRKCEPKPTAIPQPKKGKGK